MTQANQKILLLGGTFDPIHNAHLALCRGAAEELAVDKVILIPSAQPPHKRGKDITPAAVRLRMTQLAVENDPLFEVYDGELRRKGPSYTLLTVEEFRQNQPDSVLYWLVGQDMLLDLPNWYRVDALLERCHIVAAPRPDAEPIDWQELQQQLGMVHAEKIRQRFLHTPLMPVSATEIRSAIRNGDDVSDLIPAKTAQFIREQQLYR